MCGTIQMFDVRYEGYIYIEDITRFLGGSVLAHGEVIYSTWMNK